MVDQVSDLRSQLNTYTPLINRLSLSPTFLHTLSYLSNVCSKIPSNIYVYICVYVTYSICSVRLCAIFHLVYLLLSIQILLFHDLIFHYSNLFCFVLLFFIRTLTIVTFDFHYISTFYSFHLKHSNMDFY